MQEWANAIIQGVLLGGLYALFATGLSLIFGIMRLVNIAHGDFIVLAAFLALTVVEPLGIHPLLSPLLVVPVMAALGYLLQRGLLNFTLGHDILPPLLVTFGLAIIIENLLLEIFTADTQRLKAGEIEIASLSLPGGFAVGIFPLIIFCSAVVVIALLQFVSYHTKLGRIFRATSDDQETVQLVGIDSRHIFGLATAVSFGVAGFAGILMGIRTNFDPAVGPARLIYAFEAVIIGGLGNLWGTLAGGIILGVSQAIGAQIDPGWQILAGHIVFLIVLVFLPTGLFPKIED